MAKEKLKAKIKTKALVLFSGGLDSRLVVKLLQDQGLEVIAINFKLPFGGGCCNNELCSFRFSQIQGVKLEFVDCTKGKLLQEYLDIIKQPQHGRGTALNPCIDCKIFMFKKAKEYADKNKIQIIATGEVLGERPLSQTKRAIELIDRKLGFEMLRPLSAKYLPETEAEKQKLVDRTRFLGIVGRSRKRQFELAKKYDIDFPLPAGGCLLCDRNFSARLNNLFSTKKDIQPADLESIKFFRHFRQKGRILLGKTEKENQLLEQLNKELGYNIIIPQQFPGPTALFESKEDQSLAKQLIKAYSSKNLEERKNFEGLRI